MKQKEKHLEEIVELAISGKEIAVRKDGKVFDCGSLCCEDCLACITDENGNWCNYKKITEWAESEYIEPKEFTEEEKALLIALPKINWVAKDKDNIVYFFIQKPHKQIDRWVSGGHYICIGDYCSAEFKSILWEDTEPTSREDILK